VLDYWTPGGTALAETNRQVGIVERILAATPEISGTSRRTGAELGLFATAQNTGDLVARLRPSNERSRDIFAVMDGVRGEVNAAVPASGSSSLQILSEWSTTSRATRKPVEIKLFGERLDTLEAYAQRSRPTWRASRGLEDLYNGVAEAVSRADDARQPGRGRPDWYDTGGCGKHR